MTSGNCVVSLEFYDCQAEFQLDTGVIRVLARSGDQINCQPLVSQTTTWRVKPSWTHFGLRPRVLDDNNSMQCDFSGSQLCLASITLVGKSRLDFKNLNSANAQRYFSPGDVHFCAHDQSEFRSVPCSVGERLFIGAKGHSLAIGCRNFVHSSLFLEARGSSFIRSVRASDSLRFACDSTARILAYHDADAGVFCSETPPIVWSEVQAYVSPAERKAFTAKRKQERDLENAKRQAQHSARVREELAYLDSETPFDAAALDCRNDQRFDPRSEQHLPNEDKEEEAVALASLLSIVLREAEQDNNNNDSNSSDDDAVAFGQAIGDAPPEPEQLEDVGDLSYPDPVRLLDERFAFYMQIVKQLVALKGFNRIRSLSDFLARETALFNRLTERQRSAFMERIRDSEEQLFTLAAPSASVHRYYRPTSDDTLACNSCMDSVGVLRSGCLACKDVKVCEGCFDNLFLRYYTTPHLAGRCLTCRGQITAVQWLREEEQQQ